MLHNSKKNQINSLMMDLPFPMKQIFNDYSIVALRGQLRMGGHANSRRDQGFRRAGRELSGDCLKSLKCKNIEQTFEIGEQA